MEFRQVLMGLFFLSLFYAEGCPSGAGDCFLCGGVGGIPCTTNCTGHYSPGVGLVSCECPQGEPCKCYCPYEGGQTVVGGNDELISNAKQCSFNPDCANCAEMEGVKGKVAIKHLGEWCIAYPGMALSSGDSVWVLDGSMATVRYYDGGRSHIKENSEITLDYEGGPASGGALRLGMELIEGAVHFILYDSDRLEQFEIRGGGAYTGIRGTEILVERSGDAFTVKVLEGSAEAGSKTSGQKVTVNEAEYATVSDGAVSKGAFTPDEIERWWDEPACCAGAVLGAGLLVLLLVGKKNRT